MYTQVVCQHENSCDTSLSFCALWTCFPLKQRIYLKVSLSLFKAPYRNSLSNLAASSIHKATVLRQQCSTETIIKLRRVRDSQTRIQVLFPPGLNLCSHAAALLLAHRSRYEALLTLIQYVTHINSMQTKAVQYTQEAVISFLPQ